ncbi:TIGR01621 family pseudouridine synthase [Hydrogenovibrio sp. 3SP14C1]|uniref:TIGR01621 family pseudouridine synthase n=1 Tax=Hydrogenovibrio sp. 3SP14C1 TaxID=3038774 RepID=UPI002415D773|nr:TIGR01621 family pseudouridine synthase [Hydrogenovibrio sp. 3SP14C1]MDG4812893.1 TIGR01621 family pseudouridine synthase [Hydrogenovibrio sp. 3SP14C1]
MNLNTLPITVVFQSADFVVVDKPAGMNFHSEPDADGQKQPGLVVFVQQQLGVEELYPVHRLDKMTSGLVILALNKPSAQTFQQLFETRQVEKYYLAISTHKPKKKQGWVKGDMIPARRGSWKLSKTIENPAITQFISQNTRPGERWFLLKPYTGKTHQLRVALKSLGAPIAGDARYALSVEAEHEDRGYLHAFALRFTLHDESYEFCVPPQQGQRFQTAEAQTLLQQWQTPWSAFKRQ